MKQDDGVEQSDAGDGSRLQGGDFERDCPTQAVSAQNGAIHSRSPTHDSHIVCKVHDAKPPVGIVVNWSEELKQRVPTR
jgi:hypothetical protein